MNLHGVISQDLEDFRTWMAEVRFRDYEWEIVTHDPLHMRYRRRVADATWYDMDASNMGPYQQDFRNHQLRLR